MSKFAKRASAPGSSESSKRPRKSEKNAELAAEQTRQLIEETASLLFEKFKLFFGEKGSEQAFALSTRFSGDFMAACTHIKQPAGGSAIGVAAQNAKVSKTRRTVGFFYRREPICSGRSDFFVVDENQSVVDESQFVLDGSEFVLDESRFVVDGSQFVVDGPICSGRESVCSGCQFKKNPPSRWPTRAPKPRAGLGPAPR